MMRNAKENDRDEGNRSDPHLIGLMQMGTDALRRGEFQKATEFLEEANQIDPLDANVTLNLSSAYLLAKKFSQALALLTPLSERDQQNSMVWTNLGAAYLGNPVLANDEEQRRAIQAFKQALKLDPKTPHVAYNLGLIFRDRMMYREAIEWFHRALSNNPLDRDAQRMIKKLEEKLGKGKSD
jgi:tetratricopeptide (TPR) repeat protein